MTNLRNTPVIIMNIIKFSITSFILKIFLVIDRLLFSNLLILLHPSQSFFSVIKILYNMFKKLPFFNLNKTLINDKMTCGHIALLKEGRIIMSYLTPQQNDTTNKADRLKKNMNNMETAKETDGKEFAVMQENNACREDIKGLPTKRSVEL